MTLDNKIKELIAVGASVSANCQPCLEYHISKALEFDAEIDEIQQAIETGKLVRRGAAAKMDAHAAKLVKTESKQTAGADKDCGCNN
jgi:AhpD family alkylhydroperoxidase